MSKTKLFRVYSLRVAQELEKQGFAAVAVVQDKMRPQFLNWLFEDTIAFQKALKEITKI